ncbi:MAG: hypothetical protein R6W06_11550 [Prochlorococcaceae cyanobacterium]
MILRPWPWSLLAGVLPLLVLVGCGSSGSDAEVQNLPPVRRRPPLTAPTRPPQPIGLEPLPSPQAVVRSLTVGRLDPFAAAQLSPAAPAQATAAPPPSLPNFRFNGVIRSQGSVQALVQVGDQSGPLCVGQRGACAGSGLAPLLPAGWSVSTIDASNGCLTLVNAGQRQRQCLS